MKRATSILGFLWLLLMNALIHAQVEASTELNHEAPLLATLIVTYRLENASDQADGARIKFWLMNEKDQRTLYPKDDALVCSQRSCHEKVVVIPSLTAGIYWIEFALPNCFGDFEPVPLRRIELRPGEVFNLDQSLRGVMR